MEPQININTENQILQKDENSPKNLKDELKYEKFSYNKKDSKESKSSLADKGYGQTQQETHIVIPKENRPTTGTLKEDKHERLLEISLWSEVENAKRSTKA